MANAVSAFWQTVVAATVDAAQLLAPSHQASEAVYMDYSPEEAAIGQTLNVPIPGDPSGQVVDVGVGDLPISDVAWSTQAIVFNHHPGWAGVFRDFEQYNSPIRLRNAFLDAAIKGIENYVNNLITSLFTTANFTSNTAISTTAHIITTAQASQGLTVLSDKFVPVRDNPENMSLLTPSSPYYAIVTDSSWTYAQTAGAATAEAVRRTGGMPIAYGLNLRLDQQMPVSGTAPSRTFTAALMHRWAIAMAVRPLATPETTVVEVMMFNFAGIPIRIMLGYNHIKLGFVLSVDCGFGLKVVRESMCQLYSVAE
jgi:hypothetical protein